MQHQLHNTKSQVSWFLFQKTHRGNEQLRVVSALDYDYDPMVQNSWGKLSNHLRPELHIVDNTINSPLWNNRDIAYTKRQFDKNASHS